jgi:hypothetical protein
VEGCSYWRRAVLHALCLLADGAAAEVQAAPLAPLDP